MKTATEKLAGSYRTEDGKAQIEWEVTQKENGPEFSACGEYEGSAGQCIDRIAKDYPHDPQIQRIAAVWGVWHLNGMHAGTPAQEKEIARRKILAEDYARSQKFAKKYFYDAFYTDANWHALCEMFGHISYFGWCCAILREAGLYEVPYIKGMKCTGDFPVEVLTFRRGYQYGERWIYTPIPEEVLKEIASWAEFGKNDGKSLGDCKAEEFLAAHNLKLTLDRGRKAAPWQPAGQHYKITIDRGGSHIWFDFWGSAADLEEGKDPSTYSVLACIGSDIHTPTTFKEYCSEYGEDSDSREALETYTRANDFAERLRAFFTSDEQRELSEIR